MNKRFLSLIMTLAICASLMIPASAAGDNSIKQVEAGYLFSMIVTNGGDLYGCGLNTPNGRPLGPDREMITDPGAGGNIVPRPQKITENVVKIASSKSPSSQSVGSFVSGGHTLILKEGGQLYGIGDNYCGQLGMGDRKQHPGVQYIMGNVREISCSGTASFAITENGDLYWWGLLMEKNSARAQYLFEPSPVKLMSNVKDVDGGSEHVVILKNDGTVWCMGAAYDGAIGNGEQYGYVAEPYHVTTYTNAKSVHAGDCYSIVLTEDGTLYGWGDNVSGQLGLDATVYFQVYSPTKLMSGVKSVECGYLSTHVIKNDDSLWGMGWNYHGELGRGKEGNENKVKKTMDNVVSVSGGYFHTLVLKKDGGMYGCGQSYYYELGNGTRDYQVLSWIPAGLTASPIQDGSNPFHDVKGGDYFYDSVLWAVEQYITTGTSATTFSPASNCTRAQIITFLHRAAGSPDSHVGDNQKDVGPGDWFVESACWANEMGMFANTNGYFRPNDACTRGAAVEFMWRAAGAPAYDTSTLPFTDVKSSASYAQAVAWALDNGVTTGTSATTFSPNSACTRGQIVTFLYRAFA